MKSNENLGRKAGLIQDDGVPDDQALQSGDEPRQVSTISPQITLRHMSDGKQLARLRI